MDGTWMIIKSFSMALTQWLKTGTVTLRQPITPGLPDPSSASTKRQAFTYQAANDAVETVLKAVTPTRKRKRGEYSTYDDETRAKIARYAVDNGVAKAARKFTNALDRKVSETTVRSMRDQYVKLKKKDGCEMSALPQSPRGNPLLLGQVLDQEVQDWIKQVRVSGGVINVHIVMAGAEGIITTHARHKLQRFGGHINITKHWARSLLRRMGFVKRKGTKSVKKLPEDFSSIQSKFIEKVNNVVKQHSIPDSLILNWDQTGCQLVPGGDWTMETKGSQQVTISGLDDKRQITVLLTVTKSGVLLPPQIIYAGKTDRCHPNVDFPEGWDITETDSHWSTEQSMLRYVDKIVIPYVTRVRDELPIAKCDQQAVAIFDVFKAHQGSTLISKLKDNGITPLFVPACCTDRLQPLDLSVNKDYKEELKGHFHAWYAQQVMSEIKDREDEGCDIPCAVSNVDLRTSTIKPIHANWLIATHNNISTRSDLIMTGFRKAGLV